MNTYFVAFDYKLQRSVNFKQSEGISYSELFGVYWCSNAFPVVFPFREKKTRAPATEELRLDGHEITANNATLLENLS